MRSFMVSLKFLQSVLGIELRKEGEPHDCINDACAAMKLVLAKLEHGFNDPITLPKNDVSFKFLIMLHFHQDINSLISVLL